jgi:predicted AAA+ superfamily ATPase
MTLTNKGYRPRIIDALIADYLQTFGAVSVEGPKWCGKTWTTLNHANSASFLMDKNTKTLAEITPTSALEGAKPHAIDEWQEVPAIWDSVRFAVDQDTDRGQFLLTGSVTPPKEGMRHSGIGRIARLKMRTMSLFESGESSGSISLNNLLDGKGIKAGRSNLSLYDLIDVACRGGWPVNVSAAVKSPFKIPTDYLNSIILGESPEPGIQIRNEAKFAFLLSSLARNNATTVKNATLHNDVQSAAGEFSAKTLASYLRLLLNLYIIEEIPGWYPRVRSKTRVLSGSKRLFTDPSLAVAALGATPSTLRKDIQAFGGIFEGMCLRDLMIYAEANDARVFHYRDNSQLEVDAIVEKRDGSWGAFEIKLGGSGINDGAKALLSLRRKLRNAGATEPICLVVLTGSEIGMKREDGVNVVPIGMLRE